MVLLLLFVHGGRAGDKGLFKLFHFFFFRKSKRQPILCLKRGFLRDLLLLSSGLALPYMGGAFGCGAAYTPEGVCTCIFLFPEYTSSCFYCIAAIYIFAFSFEMQEKKAVSLSLRFRRSLLLQRQRWPHVRAVGTPGSPGQDRSPRNAKTAFSLLIALYIMQG